MSIINTLLALEATKDDGLRYDIDLLEDIIKTLPETKLTDKQRAFANAIIARTFTAPTEGSSAQLRKLVDAAFQSATWPARRAAAQMALEHVLADTLTERQVAALTKFAK